jgi:hypothetical protein
MTAELRRRKGARSSPRSASRSALGSSPPSSRSRRVSMTPNRRCSRSSPPRRSRVAATSRRENADRQAVVTRDYANRWQLTVGDELTIRDTALTVIGIAKPPLGRETSDIFVRLGVLQTPSKLRGRVNVLRARAASAEQLGIVANQRAVHGERQPPRRSSPTRDHVVAVEAVPNSLAGRAPASCNSSRARSRAGPRRRVLAAQEARSDVAASACDFDYLADDVEQSSPIGSRV